MFPFNGASKLAGNKGLGGNQPTSLAIGPDGAAFRQFEKQQSAQDPAAN